MRKIVVALVLLLMAVNLYAEDIADDVIEPQAGSRLFFFAPLVEAAHYGLDTPSIGFGFAFGTEDRLSFGLRVIYFLPLENGGVSTLEAAFFLRLYFSKKNIGGFFAQVNYGFAVFSGDSGITLPAELGASSVGLSLGWRFLIGTRFFIEPYIRGGYPYIGGGGLSAGVRF